MRSTKWTAWLALAACTSACSREYGAADVGYDAGTPPDIVSDRTQSLGDTSRGTDTAMEPDSAHAFEAGADGAPDADIGITTVGPEDPNGVMLQAFYWNVPSTTPAGSWWMNLASLASEWSMAGFTSVWIPPPYKGAAGANDVGYGVYDRYDLGEFDQRGTVATLYGTRAELLTAVGALHAAGIRVYADVVMNHMMGADHREAVTLLDGTSAMVATQFDFGGRAGAYSTYVWNSTRFNGVQGNGGTWTQWHAWDFGAVS